jgi:hypothetical protein
MPQTLTINLNRLSYQFQVLQLTRTPRSIESEIMLQGNKVTLLKDVKNGWILKEGSDTVVNDLIKAIGNSISLRYRI